MTEKSDTVPSFKINTTIPTPDKGSQTTFKAINPQPPAKQPAPVDKLALSAGGSKPGFAGLSYKPPTGVVKDIMDKPEAVKVGLTDLDPKTAESLKPKPATNKDQSTPQVKTEETPETKTTKSSDPKTPETEKTTTKFSDPKTPETEKTKTAKSPDPKTPEAEKTTTKTSGSVPVSGRGGSSSNFNPLNEPFFKERLNELQGVTPANLPEGPSPFRQFLGRLSEKYHRDFDLPKPELLASLLEAVLHNETGHEQRFIPKSADERTLEVGDGGASYHAWQLHTASHSGAARPMTFEESGIFAIEQVLLPMYKEAKRLGIPNPWIAATRGYNGGQDGLYSDANTTNNYGQRVLEGWKHFGGNEAIRFLGEKGIGLT